MEPIFDRESWKKYLRGFTIYDCAIVRQKGYGFVLVEESPDSHEGARTRFMTMAVDQPMEKRFGASTTNSFTFTTLACSISPPEYVAVDTRTSVYSSRPGLGRGEKPIGQLIDIRTGDDGVAVIQRVVRVNGQIYALGDYRKIYRRIGVEQWIELGSEGKGAPMPDMKTKKFYTVYDIGFKDMSAFGPDDIYAAGGSGDVWRFDGKKWHQCPFPSNEVLKTVCCAGNGKVYITDMRGAVWVGREDRWQKLIDGEFGWGFEFVDTAWFQDKLYLGCKSGLWVLDEKKKTLLMVDEVEKGAPTAMNSGRLDLSPDGQYLLTAGPHGAYLRDKDGWTRLFSSFDFA